MPRGAVVFGACPYTVVVADWGPTGLHRQPPSTSSPGLPEPDPAPTIFPPNYPRRVSLSQLSDLTDTADMGDHHAVTTRDKLSQCYSTVFSSAVILGTLILSGLLLMVSIFSVTAATSSFFHMLEFIVTVLFVAEIVIRVLLSRAAFWSSKVNILEVALCGFCILVFLVIEATPVASRAEHEMLALLRLAAQGLRLATLLRKRYAAMTSGADEGLNLAQIGHLGLYGHQDMV